MNLFLAEPVYFVGLKKGPGGGQFWPKPRRIRWLPRCRYERQRPERALPLRVLRASQPVNLAPQGSLPRFDFKAKRWNKVSNAER